jgi:hypothetical protein
MFKKDQTSEPSEYVTHSVLKLSHAKFRLDYPLDLKQKSITQEINFFLQKFAGH